jgi:hypothetical protein
MTTTDPRAAALAEALRDAERGWASLVTADLSKPPLITYHEYVSRWLTDALPPDWCKHTTWRQTDTFQVWTGTCGHLWLATTGPDCPTCADLARLRKIEEAARAHIVALDADLDREGTAEDAWNREATLVVLRAALGDETQPSGGNGPLPPVGGRGPWVGG